MMKFFILTIIFCVGVLQAQSFTVGESCGEISINGKRAGKPGTVLSGTVLDIRTGENSRFSAASSDGEIIITVAPESSIKMTGKTVKVQQGSVLISNYSENTAVSVLTASGKHFTVKEAEALFFCRSKKELFAVTDGTVPGISGNAATAKEIQKDFELKRIKKQENTKRNAPLFDQDSARPGA